MNNMKQFQPLETKLEKMGGFFGMLFMVTMTLPMVILAVFEGVCIIFQAVGQAVANRQTDERACQRHRTSSEYHHRKTIWSKHDGTDD